MKMLLIAIACGATLFMAGCQQDQNLLSTAAGTTATTTTVTSVPAVVSSALSRSFPQAVAVSWTKPSPTTYQATFSANSTARTATITNVTATGQVLYSHGQIDPATLPKAVTDYLTTTYTTYTIVNAGSSVDAVTGAVTGYMVNIVANNLAYELRFDATGKFLSVENEDGTDEGTAVAVTALPAPINSYLAANYAGAVVQNARSYMLNGVLSGYEVTVLLNNVRTELLFDATGKFVSAHVGGGSGDNQERGQGYGSTTAVTAAALPAAIGTYLAATYAGYVFQGGYAYSVNGVLAGYEVTVLLNAVYSELIFDATGKFVSVHTGGQGGDGEHNGGGEGNHTGTGSTDAVIAQTALPAVITTYLTTNYAGYTFISAKVEQTGTVITGYEVRFTLAARNYEAEFNAAGTLIKLH